MKQISITQYTYKFRSLVNFGKQYFSFMITIAMLILVSITVYRINILSNIEPSESVLDEKRAEIRAPKIDEQAIADIEKLQERNFEVRALFESARDNPFQE